MLYEVITSITDEVAGIKDLIAEHEVRIRHGMQAYALLQRLRGGEVTDELKAEFDTRITSYNVCYTKLLRAFAADVTVTEPYARAVAPGQPNSAIFMRLSNQGDSALQLVSASTPAAKVVELHTHTNDQGVMKMRRIDAIDLV